MPEGMPGRMSEGMPERQIAVGTPGPQQRARAYPDLDSKELEKERHIEYQKDMPDK